MAIELPVYCEIDAFSAAERQRHEELLNRLRAQGNPHKFDNGYEMVLAPASFSLDTISEFIGLERRCCPFWDFDLHIGRDGAMRLRMSAPPGTPL